MIILIAIYALAWTTCQYKYLYHYCDEKVRDMEFVAGGHHLLLKAYNVLKSPFQEPFLQLLYTRHSMYNYIIRVTEEMKATVLGGECQLAPVRVSRVPDK